MDRLPITIRNLAPGSAFAIEPSQLPPGTGGLRIGEVYEVTRADGQPASVLVDTVRWGDSGRIYDLVVIGERIDAIDAIRTIDALVDHLAVTGGHIVLTRGGVDLAVLTPAVPDAEQPTGWRDGARLRAVAAAYAAHQEAAKSLAQAVTAAREAGDSWEMIVAVTDRPIDDFRAWLGRDADE